MSRRPSPDGEWSRVRIPSRFVFRAFLFGRSTQRCPGRLGARVREFACTTPRAPLRRLASFCQFCLKPQCWGVCPLGLCRGCAPRYCLLLRGHKQFSRGALGTFSAYVSQQFASSTAPKTLRSVRATHTKSHSPNGACGSESADFPNLVHANRALSICMCAPQQCLVPPKHN